MMPHTEDTCVRFQNRFWTRVVLFVFLVSYGCKERIQSGFDSNAQVPPVLENSESTEKMFDNLLEWCQTKKIKNRGEDDNYFQFVYSNSEKSQILEVCQLSGEKILFVLDIGGSCRRHEFGSAEKMNEGDPELDSFSDGSGYFVLEFFRKQKGKSSFAIRIEADEKKVARIIEAEYSGSCPILPNLLMLAK